MSKSSPHKKTAPTPNPEQIAALRRQITQGDPVQARQRVAALRKMFPGFKPLLGLAWEIEDRCGEPVLATARACAWQQASPNSRAAAEALCHSAQSAGLVAMYALALRRLAALDGQEDLELPASIKTALGDLSLEQAEAIDLSRMHLTDDNPEAAIAVLQEIDHPSARNNIALALFSSGDIAQARAVADANWQAHPANLFALEYTVRWRCWFDGLAPCLGFAAPLKHTQPKRPEDAMAQVGALRFLGDDQAALQAWQAAKDGAYWNGVNDSVSDMWNSLQDASNALPGNPNQWFPTPWIQSLRGVASQQKGISSAQIEHQCNVLFDTCTAHADYLVRAVEHGDQATCMLALSVLKRRAVQADGAALAGLNALLTYPNGPDSKRIDILNWLTNEGLRDRKAPAKVWIAGELREIGTKAVRINDEQHPSPFSRAGDKLNERVHAAIHAKNLRLALDLAQQLHQMHPNEVMPLTHMAAIKEGRGDYQSEITALYRQAYAMAPDNFFARCGLARCLAMEGATHEARALLEGMTEREEFHRSEYRGLLLTQRTLATAEGDHEAAQALTRSMQELEQMQ
ncbi:MAG: hypothetical protein IPN06_04925 [Burkholderiales bacterium]|nr:hypothetical protein [Burkholderiales bacterium]